MIFVPDYDGLVLPALLTSHQHNDWVFPAVVVYKALIFGACFELKSTNSILLIISLIPIHLRLYYIRNLFTMTKANPLTSTPKTA